MITSAAGKFLRRKFSGEPVGWYLRLRDLSVLRELQELDRSVAEAEEEYKRLKEHHKMLEGEKKRLMQEFEGEKKRLMQEYTELKEEKKRLMQEYTELKEEEKRLMQEYAKKACKEEDRTTGLSKSSILSLFMSIWQRKSKDP